MEEGVLFNELIMTCVWSHLTLDDLKTCRLICTEWNRTVTPTLAKNCFFAMPTYFTTEPVLELDPRLAKKVKLFSEYECACDRENLDNVKEFLFKTSATMKEFIIHEEADFAFDLVNILNSTDFPELEKMTYLEIQDEGDRTQDKLKESILPKLRCIEYNLDDVFYYRTPPHPSHPFVQDLIRISGPRLEELSTICNFYPDLSSCQSLSKLSISLLPWTMGFDANGMSTHELDQTFDMSKVNRMVDQVKDTLVELTLDDRSTMHGTDPPPQRDAFKLPQLKQLQVLRMLATDLFDSMSPFVTPRFFPNLKTLELRAFYQQKNIDAFVTKLNSVMPLVNEVTLRGTRNEGTISKVHVIFPNVKHFSLYTVDVLPNPTDQPGDEISRLFSTFSSTSSWTMLECLEIVVVFDIDVTSVLMAVPAALFETIKKIKIRLQPKEKNTAPDNEIALEPELKERLMKTRQMNVFVISGNISLLSTVALREFVDNQKLPVYFLPSAKYL